MVRIVPAVLALALALAGCASVPQAAAPPHPEARLYAPEADAMADVDAALARAAASAKRVLLVLGANWCHDSRALAGWLETPRFAALTAARYEVVYVDVGIPQTGEGRNLEIAKRFGLADVPGTPALLVLTAEGEALNIDTAAISDPALFCSRLDALTEVRGRVVVEGWKEQVRRGEFRGVVRELLVEVRAEQNLILVKGAIPGPTNALVMIRKGVKVKK